MTRECRCHMHAKADIEADAYEHVAQVFQAEHDACEFRAVNYPTWTGPAIAERLRRWAENTRKGAKP